MPPTAISVNPSQRAIWDKLKANNHLYYSHLLAQGARDNTAAPRYASNGRWSALAYQMSGDDAFARRSYDHVKNQTPLKTFDSGTLYTGNELREHATEFTVTLDWIRSSAALSAVEVTAWRDWLFRMADAYLKTTPRLGDSDQVVGALFFFAALDRLWGSSYLSHTWSVAMRDKVKWYCETLAKGGEWIESSDYNVGTVYLLFNGAEAGGIQNFPEVLTLRDEMTKFLPHIFTPDLKDTFEWGDDQTPHDPHWLSLENVLAYLGHYNAGIRGFEAELRDVWKKPYGAPFYARYFVWADPYGERKAWREQAGLYHVSEGRGHVYARTGWTPSDAALFAQMPTFSKGRVDHWYPIFGDFWLREAGVWSIDRPRAYSASLLLGNHTIIAGLGAPGEVGALTGSAHVPGKVAYVSGTNAGILADIGRSSPRPTLIHERSVSIFRLWDRAVTLHVVRVHLDDITGIDRYAEVGDVPKVQAAPLLQALWQSQRVQPTVENGVISGDSRIEPIYPATFEVVDQVPLALGTIAATEKRWFTRVVPATLRKFDIFVTLIGDADVEVSLEADVHVIRVKKSGFPDVLIYSSAKPGPKLVTSFTTNVWGAKAVAHDPAKLDGILAARRCIVDGAPRDCDVIIEDVKPGALGYIPATGNTPEPSRAKQIVNEIRARLVELEQEID